MIRFSVNGESIQYDGPGDTPLLWVLRDQLGLTGAKYGCGIGVCGACMIHLDGRALTACTLPVSAATGRQVTTIEGLSEDGSHPVQQAWRELDVPQCGYCQPGHIMAVASFLETHPAPTDETINANITNLCRCGTYVRVRKAIHRAAEIREESRES
ncbi:MAG: (2Fe-2S)-binding protein [Xanthomonadales bacterium]|nr:(2Fe-2S)-binding protein [Xanthomonadales bacterium]